MGAASLIRAASFAGLLALSACGIPDPPQNQTVSPTPIVVATPTPSPAPRPLIEPPSDSATPPGASSASVPVVLIEPPAPARLTPAGRTLIYEFEVGGQSGYDPRPEAPDARLSGVTWGIGYDGHQNAPKVIVADWSALGEANASRLAATHPYVGASAQAHLREVRDILVGWRTASDVFDRIDVGREFASARRAYGSKDFDALRPNAQAVLISIGFNRGYSFTGENRREMREVRRLVPGKDYGAMAGQIRASERVWRGTSIYGGMKRRRFAEANLMEKP